jgi:Ca2+-binding EF-hand superfamily protein
MSYDIDEEAVKDILPPNFDEIAKAAFTKADINKDGIIDTKELHQLMKEIAKEFNYQQEVSLEEAKTALAELDLNKDGKIEYFEFRKLFIGLFIIREMNSNLK